MKLYELDEMIKLVCPISGISTDGAIWFLDEATEEQKSAARALMDEHLSTVDL